jgi:hypothetical protein
MEIQGNQSVTDSEWPMLMMLIDWGTRHTGKETGREVKAEETK